MKRYSAQLVAGTILALSALVALLPTDNITINTSGTLLAPYVYDCGGATVKSITNHGNNVVIQNCDVAGSQSHGIYTDGDNTIIQNNRVHNGVNENRGANGACVNNQWGSAIKVKIKSNGLPPQNTIIRNNEVYENCGEGIGFTRGAGGLVEGNTVRDNFSVNIYIDNSYNVRVIGNKSICTGNVLYNRSGALPQGILLGVENYAGWGYQLHDIYIDSNEITLCRPIRLYEPVAGVPQNVTITNNKFYGVSGVLVIVENAVISGNVFLSLSAGVTPTPTVTALPVTATSTPVFTATNTQTAQPVALTPTATRTPSPVPSVIPISVTPSPFATVCVPSVPVVCLVQKP